MTTNDATDDLDEQAAKRAEHVRAKRIERADPEGRVARIADQRRPVTDLDLPDRSNGSGTEGDGTDGEGRADDDGADGGDGGDDADDDTGGEAQFAPDHLPPELHEDAEDVRKKVTYGLSEEFDVEIEPDAHFWPLVVHLGVERLRTMWLEEVVDTFEAVDELETPDAD